jgi:PadR family transcriptional regulator, regulatory protein PadR
LSRQTCLVLCTMLSDPDREWYGYELTKATELASGVVCPLLRRQRQRGMMTSRLEDYSEWDGNRPPRLYYRLTAAGLELAEQAAVWLERHS